MVVYHALNMWQVPLSSITKDNCDKVVHSLERTNQGSWPANYFDEAPISFVEELVAIATLFFTIGGPIVWFFIVLPASIYFEYVLYYLVATVILALHPLPECSNFASRSYVIKCWYKYFSYRFVWVEDEREVAARCAPFIGAGVPHGVMPFANLLSVPALNTTSTYSFVGCAASVVPRTPFLRYFTLLGFTDASKKSIISHLDAGESAGIVADGIAGIFHCNNAEETVNLLNRKGIAKLALTVGVPIVPCYSIGNTECFTAVYDPWGYMEAASRKLQASIFFYWGKFGLPIPHRTKITMVAGRTIMVDKVENPTEEEIDDVHQKLLTGIKQAFDMHKESLGWGHKTMVFV